MKPDPDKPPKPSFTQIMGSVVTITVLGCALFVMLADGYDAAARNWAIGAIAGITGYWLGGGPVSPRRRG